ncbi:MAG: hypothetical protein ABFD13_03280 [Candidatus Cryosericum sp.]|nr:hypothetical protein [bacterium]
MNGPWTMTDEELERMVSAALSCRPDIVPPPDFSREVWRRIDAWEEDRRRSLLAGFLARRMRNGEPVVVLVGALAFGVLFTGVFLAGAYLFAAHSFVFLKVLQLFMGPNVVQVKSVALFFTLMGMSGALLGSLALSEHLFGRRSIRRFEPACGGSVA